MRGVLFDVDGVLLDSDPAHRRILAAWASTVDVELELLWAASHGRRLIETILEVAPHLDPLAEESRIRAIARDQGNAFPAHPGAADLLTALPPGRWGLVTSALAEDVRDRFHVAGLPIPAVLIDNRAVTRGKPHPEGYLAGAAALGLAPHDTLVVEDAPAGIAAGKAAGMRVLGVASTHETAQLHEADVCAPSLVEATPVVLTWLDG